MLSKRSQIERVHMYMKFNKTNLWQQNRTNLGVTAKGHKRTFWGGRIIVSTLIRVVVMHVNP